MKMKIVSIFVCMLFIFSAFTVVAATNSEKIKSTIEKNSSLSEDVTLITECDYQRVIEVDSDWNIIWEITGLNEPFDS